MTDPAFSCISWNIHRGRGADGRIDPDRIHTVLAEEVWAEGADALCLQEADAEAPPHRGVLDIAQVQAITGLRHVHVAAALRSTPASHGFLGVVTFLHPRWQITGARLIDLPGLHPRGAVLVNAQDGARRLRLVNTHLSLAQPLRVAQMRTIGQSLHRVAGGPTLLCGDFNEWRPWGGLAFAAAVLQDRYRGPARRTFPVGRPLLPLDRMLVTAPARIRSLDVLDGPGIRAASDHRPIYGQVALGG